MTADLITKSQRNVLGGYRRECFPWNACTTTGSTGNTKLSVVLEADVFPFGYGNLKEYRIHVKQ